MSTNPLAADEGPLVSVELPRNAWVIAAAAMKAMAAIAPNQDAGVQVEAVAQAIAFEVQLNDVESGRGL